jgi:hypothetical protein
MALEARKLAEPVKTAVLFNSQWIEVARFEGEEPVRYAVCERGTLSRLAAFCGEKRAGDEAPPPEQRALLINAEPKAGGGEDIAELLRDSFADLVPVEIEDREIRKRLKRLRVFSTKNRPLIKNRKKLIYALLVLNGISLALVLSFVSSRLSLRLESLQKTREEQTAFQEKARMLREEIAGLSVGAPEKTLPGLPVYELISEIRRSLPRGWIRSLTIQEENFSLEAEGADSLGLIRSLQNSPYFSGLSIRQAVPSENSGELFTISGKVLYEKE